MHAKFGTLSAIAAFVSLSVAGCSGNGIKTVPVHGTVTIVGRAFPKVCRLYFLPTATEGVKRPTMAETKEDGTYNVKAFKGQDGLVPGSYKVNVQYLDLKPGADPGLDGSWIQHFYSAPELTVDANSRSVEHNIEIPKAKS